MSKTRIKIGIYSSAFLALGLIAIASDLEYIIEAFPQYDSNLVVTIMSSSAAIMAIPTTAIVGRLINYFPKRAMMLIAIIDWLVAGTLPYFLGNIWIILVCRIFFGIGVGMIQTLCAALVVQYFDDPTERNKVMGAQTAFQSGGGMIFALVCGILSNYGWNVAFLTHLVGIPSLILCLFCLPNDKPVRAQVATKKDKPKFKPSAVMWFWAIGFMVFACGAQTYGNYTASVVADMGIGGSTQASFAMIGYAIGGFLFGLVFGRIASVLKRFTFFVGAVLYAVGFIMVGLAPNLIVAIIGSFISGSTYSICLPYALNGAANSVEPDSSETATSLVNCGMSLGSTFNPLVIAPIATAIFGMVPALTSNQLMFLVASAFFIVVAVVLTAMVFATSRKASK